MARKLKISEAKYIFDVVSAFGAEIAKTLRTGWYQNQRLDTPQIFDGQSYNLKGGIHFISDDSQHSGEPRRSGPVISRVLGYVTGISLIQNMSNTYQK